MATWADEAVPLSTEYGKTWKRRQQLQQESSTQQSGATQTAVVDEKSKWANAKTVTEFVTDSDNKRYEVTKKVRTYHVDRPVTPVDIRAKWAKFGKGTEVNKDLVSLDPPVVLELGSIDPVEKATRDEIVRLMAEVERTKVTVNDVRLAEFAKRREEQLKEAEERKEAEAVAPKEGLTWASRERPTASMRSKVDDSVRRIRVSNITDEITEDELYNIFDTEQYVVEKLFLPKDKETGNYKGYAFITYATEAQAELVLTKTSRRVRFKNTVLILDHALPQK